MSQVKHGKRGSRGNKRRGALYEAAFNYYAQKTGSEVFTSNADYSVIDAIVVSDMRRIYRVQIKGTEQTKVVTVKTTRGANLEKLNKDEYDVLAVFAAAYNIWYLIPSHMVNARQRLKIYPMFPDSQGQYEMYRDNWKIFK